MSGAGADFAKLDFLQLFNKAFYVNEEKKAEPRVGAGAEGISKAIGVGADRK